MTLILIDRRPFAPRTNQIFKYAETSLPALPRDGLRRSQEGDLLSAAAVAAQLSSGNIVDRSIDPAGWRFEPALRRAAANYATGIYKACH